MSERNYSLRQKSIYDVVGTRIFFKVGPPGAFALKTPAPRHRTVEGMNSPALQATAHLRPLQRTPVTPELRAGGP